jgi:segregation and condensation protein A
MYTVALLNFEGPLDLLLQLIERSDMEITEISLSDITSQYLQYIAELPALGTTELNQFLELASRLIYLKSIALLPLTPTQEIDSEISELTDQLAQYQNYQVAANYLKQLISRGGRSWPRQATPILPLKKLPMPNVNTKQLQEYFTKVMANLPESPPETTYSQEITLTEMSNYLSSWLAKQSKPTPLTIFLQPFKKRQELIVSFMALLELIRLGDIIVSQEKIFGDILVMDSRYLAGRAA